MKTCPVCEVVFAPNKNYSKIQREKQICCSKDCRVKRKTRTHGKTHTQVYKAWENMKSRCFCKNNPAFHHYGGRGITICQEWLIFENFHKDMGDPPDKYTLDRINVNGNYEKSNCRWATRSQQMRNTRSTRLSEEKVETAKDLIKSGISHRRAAKIIGVKRPTMTSAVYGETWKN